MSGGHAKLKRSLLLRDFLAHDLGLSLKDAECALSAAETDQGAAEAFAEGRFLDALRASADSRRRERIHQLDDAVRDACRKSDFSPRYPQYLALALMAHVLDRLSEDSDALLDAANAFRQAWVQLGRNTAEIAERNAIAPFSPGDIQIFAFWMATGVGKTHVLHACLALLETRFIFGARGFDRIVLVTPSESLSRQHALELRRSVTNPVFVYPDDGDGGQIAHLPRDTVIVVDINKLRKDKKGDGFTLDAGIFRDARNLVFVDEGHKGQKTEESVWKAIQSQIAGIGHAQRRYRGMLIEFSATFGQVAEAEHAFDRYAKSVVYEYSYDRFHADLYGKDFDVRNLSAAGGGPPGHEDALAASLVAYWHQLHAWQDACVRADIAAHGLEIEKPLWVLLGLTVLGKKESTEKEYRTDIIEAIMFLAGLFRPDGRRRLADHLKRMGDDRERKRLPESAWQIVRSRDTEELAQTILKEAFHWKPGAVLRLRVLKRSPGEIAMGLLLGDRMRYFGVVNVGDAEGLRDALKPQGIDVENDALASSLFAGLDRAESDIHVLIGSRRFSEGWNNYRASTLTLLRLGSSEGPLIIQMFGRVVRFRGRHRSGKRLESPPEPLRPLQTAYVFGLRADYMTAFLNTLHANGIQDIEWKPTQRIEPASISRLIHLSAADPARTGFKVTLGKDWFKRGKIDLSYGATVQTATMRDGQTQTNIAVLEEDITADFTRLSAYLDIDAICKRMLDYRAAHGWWNLSFDRNHLRAALRDGTYTITGDSRMVQPQCRVDLHRLEGVAVTLLQRMMCGAYRRVEARQVRYRAAALRADNEMIVEKVFVRG